MKAALITGSAGLIGSESSTFLHQKGFHIIGIDNDMRAYFFGPDASTKHQTIQLKEQLNNYYHYDHDIRSYDKTESIFRTYGTDIKLIIHTAGQPSHDWAAREPFTDFTINANATLNLLEGIRKYCSDAVFIFVSTNKVYGDTPNQLPLNELNERWELDASHKYFQHGIDESMSIDNTTHSLFGVSKLAADIMVQEYGKYFGMKTVAFRAGCLTGPDHCGAEQHGFLAYLVNCAVRDKPYTIFGYKGKQVRDNMHSYDLVNAFWHFYLRPKKGEVYNIGGSRHSNISILEGIRMIHEIGGSTLRYKVSMNSRIGDHIWYISDVRKFKRDFPDWDYKYDMKGITIQLLEAAYKKSDL